MYSFAEARRYGERVVRHSAKFGLKTSAPPGLRYSLIPGAAGGVPPSYSPPHLLPPPRLERVREFESSFCRARGNFHRNIVSKHGVGFTSSLVRLRNSYPAPAFAK